MPETARLLAEIETAAGCIAPWRPLQTVIAINPLQGLEHLPFEAAAAEGARLFGGHPWPNAAMVAPACATGRIDPAVLAACARQHGRSELATPAALVEALQREAPTPCDAAPADLRGDGDMADAVDRLMIKWLAAFLDEGQAAWAMPARSLGFYRAWRRVAAFDPQIPGRRQIRRRPDDALMVIATALAGLDTNGRDRVLTAHLTALPGWVAYIRWRMAEAAAGTAGIPVAPVTLADYLAVRITLAQLLGVAVTPAMPSVPAAAGSRTERSVPAGQIALEAWEESHRQQLALMLHRNMSGRRVMAGRAVAADRAATAPVEAQIVFCIDVRSEVLRRHLEAAGPYATLGFAGFFGVPVAVRPFGEPLARASCPVLLRPRHVVAERPVAAAGDLARRHLQARHGLGRIKGLIAALKSGVAGAFAFVEASGLVYGGVMVARTLAPRAFERSLDRLARRVVPPVPVTPMVDLHDDHHGHDHGHAPDGLSPAEQVFFAEGALRVMGLTQDFAPLVVLCGHGGHTVNNPFASGLDCGACGGNRGGPNARIMAAMLNKADTRQGLARRGIHIPPTTRFAAAEHDTTTDAVTLYPDPQGSAEHAARLARLTADLGVARLAAVAERCRQLTGAAPAGGIARIAVVERRAADWSEVRPEWALARNAAFIVGHRSLTAGLDLGGRAFLHSYDWRADGDGRLLDVILTAPMVVAEWINMQYYFSTVDNRAYGAGSKVTHNVVGAMGVMQGNASDLMTGLALQSVMATDDRAHHEPLRLLTVVEAPRARLDVVIARHAILSTLFDNGWVALMVADPETGRFWRRARDGGWHPARMGQPVATPVARSARHDAPAPA